MSYFIVKSPTLIVLLLVLVFVRTGFAENSLNELLRDAAEQNRRVASLIKAGKFREALPHSRRSLEIWETALGDDHPNIVHRINSLAAIYETLGEYAESESLYRRALSIREKVFGSDHPAVAESLTHLGRVCRKQGRFGEAESLDRRAAEIRKIAGGWDSATDAGEGERMPAKRKN